ncbi:hypothetical protein E2C01_059862 [Portunus trituberculatus]|uniref:Uncharacterized protein n=1 Tax=Portunus trituberculatus TaxID=210409 RepID=A0A5B7H6Z9_PORTR|nr:hypothetical protein [Portunus trituberculatus]
MTHTTLYHYQDADWLLYISQAQYVDLSTFHSNRSVLTLTKESSVSFFPVPSFLPSPKLEVLEHIFSLRFVYD